MLEYFVKAVKAVAQLYAHAWAADEGNWNEKALRFCLYDEGECWSKNRPFGDVVKYLEAFENQIAQGLPENALGPGIDRPDLRAIGGGEYTPNAVTYYHCTGTGRTAIELKGSKENFAGSIEIHRPGSLVGAIGGSIVVLRHSFRVEAEWKYDVNTPIGWYEPQTPQVTRESCALAEERHRCALDQVLQAIQDATGFAISEPTHDGEACR